MTGQKRPRGRPPVPADQRMSEVVRLRLTPGLAAKLARLGGIAWLRDRLRGARYP